MEDRETERHRWRNREQKDRGTEGRRDTEGQRDSTGVSPVSSFFFLLRLGPQSLGCLAHLQCGSALQVKPFWKLPNRYSYRCASMVILNAVVKSSSEDVDLTLIRGDIDCEFYLLQPYLTHSDICFLDLSGS